MYATVRMYSDTDERFVDGLQQNEDAVKRLLQDIPGFQGYYVVKGSGGGTATISVYNDQAGAEASNKAAREWVQENLGSLNVGAPQIVAGEVAIQF